MIVKRSENESVPKPFLILKKNLTNYKEFLFINIFCLKYKILHLHQEKRVDPSN